MTGIAKGNNAPVWKHSPEPPAGQRHRLGQREARVGVDGILALVK